MTPEVRSAMVRGGLIGFVIVFAVAVAVMLAVGVDAGVAILAALFGALVIGGGLGAMYAGRLQTGRN